MEHIRPATISDVSRIAEMIITNYRINFYPFFKNDPFYFGELNVLDMAKEYKEGSENLKNCFVYDDGAVKGVIRISGTEIEKLFIEPTFQSQGIGAKLLNFAIENHNADRLWVLEYNKRGIEFYKKHGFSLTGEKMIEDEWVPLLKMELAKEKSRVNKDIDLSKITACGECCDGCKKKADGICKGCIEADGYVPEWEESGRCKVHECTRKQGVQFCGLCEKFPCDDITKIVHWNSDIIKNQTILRDKFKEQQGK